MNPNTHSTQQATGGLDRLAAAVDHLAADDPDALPDAQAAQRVLVLPGGSSTAWKATGCGSSPGWTAAAPPAPKPAPRAEATAAWPRHRTRMGHPDAHQRVRVARAVHRGPSRAPPMPSPTARSATCTPPR